MSPQTHRARARLALLRYWKLLRVQGSLELQLTQSMRGVFGDWPRTPLAIREPQDMSPVGVVLDLLVCSSPFSSLLTAGM